MSETVQPAAEEAKPAEGVSSDTQNTDAPAAETSESPAPETEPADDAGAETPKRESKGVQKRIDELTARAYRAERQAEEMLALLRQQTAAQQPANGNPAIPQAPTLPPELASAIPPAPKPEDFPAGEFDPKYAVALAKHEMRMEQAQAFARQQQMQRQQAAAQMQANLAQQVERLTETDPQARDTIAALGMRLPNPVADMVAEAGAEVAYYIARNPEAEKQIAEARSRDAVARAIGRIEARLEAARAAPSQPTAAPAPPPRAAKGTASASRTPYDARDFDEYKRLRGF